MKMQLQKPRGTRDILPEEQKYWRFIEDIVDKRCGAFGFGKIETPIMENKELYAKGIGQATDIVEKEMYSVKRFSSETANEDDDKSELVLRPEYTAGIVRAYLEDGMQSWPQPIKLYSFGPIFRYDRPQKGRFRQFWQFNTEVIGDSSPLTDALLILLVWQIFQDLGLKNQIVVEINSLGCKSCRNKIKKQIIDYYKKYKNALCLDCQRRLDTNPFRLLDCKELNCQKIAAGSPQIIDNLCSECKKQFMQVLEYLDELGITYDLNPRLVRGLDYYTRTTFEVRDINDKNRQSSLGGGGRYDNLVEIYGGRPTPAIGFAGGIERIIDKLKELEIDVGSPKVAEIYIIQIGEKAKRMALRLISDLGSKGFSISSAFGKDTLKSQLRTASKNKARIALIIGQREALDKSVIVRDMMEASQETVDLKDLETLLIKKLRSS